MLEKRTKSFALAIIYIVNNLSDSLVAQTLGKQVLRSGTSVGAQYYEGCRARSKTEFIAKVGGALQELNETVYWLELLLEANIISSEKIHPILKEAHELTAMLICSSKTAKASLQKN